MSEVTVRSHVRPTAPADIGFDNKPASIDASTLPRDGEVRTYRQKLAASRLTLRPPVRTGWFQPLWTAVQMAADAGTIVLSFYLGFALWNAAGPTLFPGAYEPIDFSRNVFALGVTLVTCLCGFWINGLYQPQRSLLNIREFEVILKTCLIGCGISLAILFLAKEHFFSRGVFASTWVSLLALMFVQRSLAFGFQNRLRTNGFIETGAVIYGAGVVGRKLLEKLRQSPKLGYQVMGFVDDDSSMHGRDYGGVMVMGGFSELAEILKRTGAQKLFIALSRVPHKVVQDILKVCEQTGCRFEIVPSLYDIVIQRAQISEVDGIPLIGVSEPRYRLRTRIAKRVFDVTVAAALLVLFAPVMLIIAAGVKLTSRGPVFFLQKRVGRNGRRFVFYKYRTMYLQRRAYALTPGGVADSRVTPLGRLLRRASLDELPQLWNVLKGDMSLVGPRPEMPFLVARYDELQRQRLNVLPGITGLWQISKDRKLAIHHNMDYDIYYIQNQSLLLDIVIMVRTFFSCLKGEGAY